MCIRITKELKQVYETEMHIDLSRKIPYQIFGSMLTKLGYLNNEKFASFSPSPSSVNHQLVQLGWNTISTKCPTHEIVGYPS